MRVVWQVIVKEFLQIRRDLRMIPVIFVAPVVQIAIFGFAVNTDVTKVPMVLVDQDRSATSRELVSRFVDSGYFEMVASEEQVEAAERWLAVGRAQLDDAGAQLPQRQVQQRGAGHAVHIVVAVNGYWFGPGDGLTDAFFAEYPPDGEGGAIAAAAGLPSFVWTAASWRSRPGMSGCSLSAASKCGTASASRPLATRAFPRSPWYTTDRGAMRTASRYWRSAGSRSPVCQSATA